MAAKVIANNLETLHTDYGRVSESAAHLDSISKSLFSTLVSLNATWSGTAHDAYEASVRADEELMGHVLKVLYQFADELEDAEKKYRNNESWIGNAIDTQKV